MHSSTLPSGRVLERQIGITNSPRQATSRKDLRQQRAKARKLCMSAQEPSPLVQQPAHGMQATAAPTLPAQAMTEGAEAPVASALPPQLAVELQELDAPVSSAQSSDEDLPTTAAPTLPAQAIPEGAEAPVASALPPQQAVETQDSIAPDSIAQSPDEDLQAADTTVLSRLSPIQQAMKLPWSTTSFDSPLRPQRSAVSIPLLPMLICNFPRPDLPSLMPDARSVLDDRRVSDDGNGMATSDNLSRRHSCMALGQQGRSSGDEASYSASLSLPGTPLDSVFGRRLPDYSPSIASQSAERNPSEITPSEDSTASDSATGSMPQTPGQPLLARLAGIDAPSLIGGPDNSITSAADVTNGQLGDASDKAQANGQRQILSITRNNQRIAEILPTTRPDPNPLVTTSMRARGGHVQPTPRRPPGLEGFSFQHSERHSRDARSSQQNGTADSNTRARRSRVPVERSVNRAIGRSPPVPSEGWSQHHDQSRHDQLRQAPSSTFSPLQHYPAMNERHQARGFAAYSGATIGPLYYGDQGRAYTISNPSLAPTAIVPIADARYYPLLHQPVVPPALIQSPGGMHVHHLG